MPTTLVSTIYFCFWAPILLICGWGQLLLCDRYGKQPLPAESSWSVGNTVRFPVAWCTGSGREGSTQRYHLLWYQEEVRKDF